MPSGVYEHPSAQERFWQKVRKVDNGCWEWIASFSSSGYGAFWYGQRMIKAHSFAYQLLRGTIPNNLELDHLCRNRHCVNPDHLEVVTHQENCQRGECGLITGQRQLSKTHCSNGHPYSGKNIYYTRTGSRQCRICRRLWDISRRAKLRNYKVLGSQYLAGECQGKLI